MGTFSFIKLWPDFSLVWNWQVSTAHGFSALIVAALLCFAIVSGLYAIFRFFQALWRINTCKKLLKGVTHENLTTERRNILKNAKKKKKCGSLWKEFDESLVYSKSRKKLYNTLDASHFFNGQTLGKGLIENRLLSAVPGFLTAIGVLGTFAGLQMGLSTLELSKDAGVDALRAGIGNMISGASIAFITSVWGVFTSLLFNFFEKLLERILRYQISGLQKKIDYLFPRITPEEPLLEIEDYTHNSDQILSGLAEKIGDRLQETLTEVNTSLQEELKASLEEILKPALQSLVDGAKDTSTDALRSIVDAFLEQARNLGKDQSAEMEKAASKLETSIEGFSGVLKNLSQTIETQTHASDKTFQDVLAKFQDLSTEMLNNLQQQNSGLLSDVSQHIENISSIAENIGEKADNTIRQTSEATSQQLNSIKEAVTSMQDRESNLASRIEGLIDSFDNLAESNKHLSNRMTDNAYAVETLSSRLTQASNDLYNSAQQLSEGIVDSIQKTQELNTSVDKLIAEVHKNLGEIGILANKISDVATTMERTSEHAENGFSKLSASQKELESSLQDLFASLKDELNTLLEDLIEQTRKLLEEYGGIVETQTRDRLNDWNKQTSEFTSTMVDAIRTLAGVVDEMEQHLKHR